MMKFLLRVMRFIVGQKHDFGPIVELVVVTDEMDGSQLVARRRTRFCNRCERTTSHSGRCRAW